MRVVERLTARQLRLTKLLADILHDTLLQPGIGPPGALVSRAYARAPEVCPALRVNAHDPVVPRAVRVTIAAPGASA